MWWNLNWNDRFVAKLEQEVDGVPAGAPSPFYFGIDGEALIFRFTAEEFKMVYTALKNGCDLTYGERAQQVLWYFMRNVEYPEIPEPVNCEDIQDCIEETPGTRQTIQDIVYQGTQPPGGSVYGGSADDDVLFGQIRFLVDTVHDGIVDVFQAASAVEGLAKRARLILEAIPPVELLPIDEGAEYVQSLVQEIGTLFNGQYTTTPITGSRDRISCGLLCLAQANDNTLTWAMIRDYFWGLVAYESPGLNQFVDFAGYLITGTWAGQDIVNISFANFAAAMDASGRYGELLFPALSTIMKLGANNPDPDWATVCEECPETWSHCIAFTEEPGPFGPYGGFSVGTPGTWNSGDGWQGEYCVSGPTAYHMVQIGFEFDTPTTVTRMRMKGSVVNGTQGGVPFILGTNTGELLNAGVQPDGEFELEASGEALNATSIYLRAQSGTQPGAIDPGGIVIVRELCVWGDGPNPFEEGAGLRRAAPTWPILPKPGDVRPEGF